MNGRSCDGRWLAGGARDLGGAGGGRRPPDPELNSPEAIRTLHDFGICLARNHSARSRVADVLTIDFRAEAARDAIRDLIGEHDPCVASSRVFYYVTSSNSCRSRARSPKPFCRAIATSRPWSPTIRRGRLCKRAAKSRG